MLKGLIGKKVGMTRLFTDGGRQVPVTLLELGPCSVVQVKTPEREKYAALQIGFGVKKAARTNKPAKGHYAKAGLEPMQVLQEFRVDDPGSYTVGQALNADMFMVGEKVNITGTSKGRGFTGVVKRHGFGGGRDTHGCTTHDAPGSIGASADPSRVMKGRKMPGHHGNAQVMTRNLKIVDVRDNLLIVKGAVPGSNGSIVVVEKA